jgi:hypothetical protein
VLRIHARGSSMSHGNGTGSVSAGGPVAAAALPGRSRLR